MGKKFRARNCKRESNLGTTETILKVLTNIYYAKKAGKKYSISQICRDEHMGSLNTDFVEDLYDWSYQPTIDLAEGLRQKVREYQKEHWKYYSKPKEEPVIIQQSESIPMLEFEEDPMVKERNECNDFGILTWNGHRYRLVPID
jgi:hypothetical protein